MIIQDSLKKFGDYVLLMRRVFTIPDRWREFFKRYISEIYKLGIDSIPIVITISVFIGAVIAIQMQKNVVSPMIPAYAVGLATRDVILLEFSSSILCLILAGKVGSNIASEIGTMRVTEQIDALEIMGVNSANLLILPKIAAMVSFIPVLVVFSMASGITGGFLIAQFTDIISVSKYIYGLQSFFNEYYIWQAIFKALFFAFVISSVVLWIQSERWSTRSRASQYRLCRRKQRYRFTSRRGSHSNFILMIEVNNISKSFDGKVILHNVSAKFYSGKTNLIIGQSGSGKTVLMKCIVGLMQPDKGQVIYDGRDITSMSASQIKELRNEIGMLFQGSALFDSETVLGNVMFPLRMFTRDTYAACKKRAEFCLERVNLKGVNDLYPSEISGGMQKRVAIARAIALNPKYLFCDEPNSGLDPKTSILIDELLSDITHEYNITTIINTHDMNSVIGIGENIVFINKGHREWVGNRAKIFTSSNEALNDFVFATRLFKEVKGYMIEEYRKHESADE